MQLGDLQGSDAARRASTGTDWHPVHVVCFCCSRCEQLLDLMSHMSGLSVKDVNDYSISLGIDICVPTSRQEHSSSE